MLNITDKERFRIMGMALPLFVCVASVVFAATYMDALPRGMVGAFPLMMLIGALSTLPHSLRAAYWVWTGNC